MYSPIFGIGMAQVPATAPPKFKIADAIRVMSDGR